MLKESKRGEKFAAKGRPTSHQDKQQITIIVHQLIMSRRNRKAKILPWKKTRPADTKTKKTKAGKMSN
jgi:hypothetical protein